MLASKELKLSGNWLPYGGSYGTPSYTLTGDICVVDGLIKHSGWSNTLAVLPAACRPSKRLIFNLNNHAKVCRVDVDTNGVVSWISGGKDHAWISFRAKLIHEALDPKFFCNTKKFFVTSKAKAKATSVALTNSWRSYGGSYGTATWRVSTDESGANACFVEGLIRSGKYGLMATLPAACRPNKRLIFEVNNHAKQCRVDVLSNGQVYWVSGGKDHSWVSLTQRWPEDRAPDEQLALLRRLLRHGHLCQVRKLVLRGGPDQGRHLGQGLRRYAHRMPPEQAPDHEHQQPRQQRALRRAHERRHPVHGWVQGPRMDEFNRHHVRLGGHELKSNCNPSMHRGETGPWAKRILE